MAVARGKAMLEAALKKGKIDDIYVGKDEKRMNMKRKGVYKIYFILFIIYFHIISDTFHFKQDTSQLLVFIYLEHLNLGTIQKV